MSAPRDKFDQYSGVRDGAEGVGPVSRVRVLVGRECEHGSMMRHYPDSEVVWGPINPETGKMGWEVDLAEPCPGGTTTPLTEFPPEAVEAAKRAAFAVERMRGETLTEYNNRKMSVALAAALEAITKEEM